jgi:uncharacterized protein YyaL (SSP411 family)
MACVWYRRTGDARFLERARRSAAYLLQVAPTGVRGPTDGRVYTFDTGIFASALLDLFTIGRQEEYLIEAHRRLEWLLQRASGGSPAATVPEEGVRPGPDAWPLRRSVHLAKMALPLLKGWRATGEDRFREAASRLFDWALALQHRDGRFAIDERSAATMTHPHCYATEALLYAAWALKDDDLRAAFDSAAAWLADTQNDDGSFYRWYGRFDGWPVRTKVSDATAQALRLWRITGMHEPAAERAQTYLNSVAMRDGGLPNYVRALGPVRWRQNDVCSWPTFFWHHARTIDFGDTRAAEELF